MFGNAPWYGPLLLLLPLAGISLPFVLVYFAYRFLKAYESRGGRRDTEQGLRARIAALEEQVARLTRGA